MLRESDASMHGHVQMDSARCGTGERGGVLWGRSMVPRSREARDANLVKWLCV